MSIKSLLKCIAAFIAMVITRICSPWKKSEERQRLEDLTARKQNERIAEFKRLRSLYPFGAEQKKIVALGWDLLVGQLQTRELSATAVLRAYIAKALEVSDKCNPLTEFIPTAHDWAKELDEMKEVKGPFHGVPFCVKDGTDVVGLDTTLGLANRLYKPASESAVIVKVLQDLGGIPFVKTNVPQTMFSGGSDNPIFGTTTNFQNEKLSPGGSSSGTGALVGGGGALFGTGTDIGGSLRTPAHCNGVATLRPTSMRVSMKGCVSPLAKAEVGVSSSAGIIAQNPSIVATIMKKYLESGKQLEYDSLPPPIPWNTAAFEAKKPLRIGYFQSLSSFPPMGDSTETLLRGKMALESLGHTLVPFDMPDCFELYMTIMGADNLRHLKNAWENETVAKCLKRHWLIAVTPKWLQRLIGKLFLIKGLKIYSKRTASSFSRDASTTYKFWEAMGERQELRNKVLKQWVQLRLDALICNVHSNAALPIDCRASTIPSPYAVVFNLIDFPVGVVPLGQESGKKLDEFDDQGDAMLKMFHQGAKDSVGAPIGIQVVGKPWQEETVLNIMNQLEPFNTFKKKEQ